MTDSQVKPEDVLRRIFGDQADEIIADESKIHNVITERLQQSFDKLVYGLRIHAMGLDIARLNLQLLQKILVDKGIINQDELNELYEKYVTNVLEQARVAGGTADEGETMDKSAGGQEESSE